MRASCPIQERVAARLPLLCPLEYPQKKENMTKSISLKLDHSTPDDSIANARNVTSPVKCESARRSAIQ